PGSTVAPPGPRVARPNGSTLPFHDRPRNLVPSIPSRVTPVMSESLKRELKDLIVATAQLPDLRAEAIDDGAALFGEGLDLDSIDALELVMQLEKRYGIKI